MPEPQEGDRFRHRKFGLGTAKRYYPKTDGVYMFFDSGHKTVCARTRLIPINELSTEQKERVQEQKSVKVTRSKAAGSANVDYKALKDAKDYFEKKFPDAHRVVPKIYGSRVYCEVWTKDGHAQNHFIDRE